MEEVLERVMTWWSEWGPMEHTLLVAVGGLLVYAFYRRVAIPRLTHFAKATDNDVDDRLVDFIRQFFGVVLFVGVVGAVLHVNGVEISPLLAGAGIAGIAVAMAAKETIGDILAGVFLIADRPLRVGDRVKIEHIGRHWGSWGDVLDIGLRRTRVRNTDGVVVNYPNHALASSVIVNFSDAPGPVRVRVRFQTGYEADPTVVKAVATQAIQQTDGVLDDTADVLLRTIWDDTRGHMLHGALYEGRYRIDDIRARSRIRSAVLTSILGALQEAGIQVAVARVSIAP